jgi:hypothetical protein
MKYKIIDVKLYALENLENELKYNPKIGRYWSILQDSMLVFLNKINAQFVVENTNILNIHIYDIKQKGECSIYDSNYIVIERFNLGGFDHIGTISTFLDKDYLLQIVDINDVHCYLNNWIYNTLKAFATNFNEETQLLDLAFEKMSENDFYTPVSKRVNNRNKTHTAWLESFKDFDKDIYQLVVLDNNSLEKAFYTVVDKMPWRQIREEKYKGHESDINYILENPVTYYFEIDGWKKNDCFCFHWGEGEKYIYDNVKKELKLNKQQ